MLVVRILAVLVALTVAGSLGFYLLTRDRRYLTLAWRVFQFALVFLLVFFLLYILERIVLVI